MQNNPDVVKKAKQYIKRYIMWCIILAFCVVLGYFYVAFWVDAITALVVCILIIFIGSLILFNKCILSILNKKLDADTYLATVYLGKFDTPAALWQLYGEYYCGHYQNVISICKMKLDNPKLAKRYKYHYFTYLANVYFDIGDNEKLRTVCEQYEVALANEKPRKQANCRRYFTRMTFYDFYLKKNIDDCITWVNTPTSVMLNQYHRTFCKARLAILQEKAEEANMYYETLVKEVPQLNYGKLAVNQFTRQSGDV